MIFVTTSSSNGTDRSPHRPVPARLFAPLEQRDGVGFSKAGPIEQAYLDHAEKQMRVAGVEVERWRALYAEWVALERARLRN